ncbi:MAG TPA: Yip1 family protein [Rhodocyclaceae bacterium]|nr:Yip1 family protein [Rhodocyclaceae bacterium]
MNPSQMPKMMLSFHEGWDELIGIHPSISRMLLLVVLPLSVLPPAMIYYAGSNYGDIFSPEVSAGQWHIAAGIFFLAELLTVPAMAWIMHLACRANDVPAAYHECFTLAAIAPIPMWISSLVLFVPNLAVGVVVGALGLLCSLAITYRGMYALFRMHEDLRAMQMATVVTGAGLLGWLVLMQIVLVH